MNIGIFGYGNIGSGVDKITKDNVTKIYDIEAKKELIGDRYVSDPYLIINDPEIETVVEAMGGDAVPYELIKASLKNKKNVVTSNKEVVALHLNEFLTLSKENKVIFLFEASVGGGVPIINSLELNTKVNSINKIYGIINGSTNYILTKIEEGLTKEEAMNLARVNGFLEKDPTQDLEGLDMVRKIAILSDIAYDTFIDINDVYHHTIDCVTKEMIDYLKINGYTIKFVASSELKNGIVSISVEPRVISLNNILSRVKNEYNSIVIDGSTNGTLEFYGKGAGKLPTASAILSDIERIKVGSNNYFLNLKNSYKIDSPKYAKYFVVDENNNMSFINGADLNEKYKVQIGVMENEEI